MAASLGWMLDAFDIMLYSMLLASIVTEMRLTKGEAGLLGSVTLLASAAGGLMFGVIADRAGRTRALMGSIALYSVFTALCGTASSFAQLAIFRICLGVGMGGEWASGAALVSETWPAQHRGKAFGFMQSFWAIGYGAAALATALVLPRYGWRAVFFVGALPALFTLWIQRNVKEPEIWRQRKFGPRTTDLPGTRDLPAARDLPGTRDLASTGGPAHRFTDAFRGPLGKVTLAVTLMNACTMFGWWGLNLWVPAYLSMPPAQGGIGLSTYATSGLVFAMQVGMWFGYVTFGFISDSVGRKRAYIAYLIVAAFLLPLYGFVRLPLVLLALGPFVAFFGTGYYSGFGPLTAELYPTTIRASAQGFTYNIGRVASAAAPFTVGTLAETRGFAPAFAITGAAFLLAAVCWFGIPETMGRELE